MKTIGLIGGMSWESTVTYYQVINRVIGRELGGLHSARIAMHSVEFDEIQKLQHAGRWAETGEILAGAARSLQRAGADFLVLCTNTMHIVSDQIEVRNTRDLPIKVEIKRNFRTQYHVLKNTGDYGEYEKEDMDTIKLTVPMKPESNKIIDYTLTTYHGENKQQKRGAQATR